MAEPEGSTPGETKKTIPCCVSCGQEVSCLKGLPCLHPVGVCEKEECLQKLSKEGISCQQCNEVLAFPPKGLPPCQYAMKEFACVSGREGDKGGFCVEDHNEPQPAVAYCLTCLGALCEECCTAHTRIRALKTHQVELNNSTGQSHTRGPVYQDALVCTTHNEVLRLYCATCCTLICSLCSIVSGSHNSHQLVQVDSKAGQKNRETLEACLTSATHKLATMQAAEDNMDAAILTLHRQCEEMRREILTFTEEATTKLKEKSEELIDAVNTLETKKETNLKYFKKRLHHHLNRFHGYNTALRKLMEDGTMTEQISLTTLAVYRLCKLLDELAISKGPDLPRISFTGAAKKKKMLDIVENLKFLTDYTAHYDLVIDVTSLVGRLWSTTPLMFLVVTREDADISCQHGGKKLKAVLTSCMCGASFPGEVEDKGDGTYRIRFHCLPSSTECRLEVTIGDKHIQGSPKMVNVEKYKIRREIRDDSTLRRFRAVTFTKEGSLLATDKKNKEICLFKDGKFIWSFPVAGAGEWLDGIAVLHSGHIVVSDYNNRCVYTYTIEGKLVRKFGMNHLTGPSGMAVNSKGHLFIADYNSKQISVYDEHTKFMYSFCPDSSQPEMCLPQQLCIDPSTQLVFISDYDKHCVHCYQQDGTFVRQFGQNVLTNPSGIAVNLDGLILVESYKGDKISVFTSTGECVHEIKDIGLKFPYGLAIDDNGFIFIADDGNKMILKI